MNLISPTRARILMIIFMTLPGVLHSLGAQEQLVQDRVASWGLQVSLPAGYTESSERYAVAYMTDGLNLFKKQPGSSSTLWEVDKVRNRLAAQGLVKPFIIVGINQRFPPVEDLVGKIIPYIDAHYKTIPEPSQRALLGSSGGASYSLLCVMTHPEIFGLVGALSLPCFTGVFDFVENQPKVPIKIWIDNGTEEPGRGLFASGSRTLVQMLKNKGWVYGRDLFYLEEPGVRHTEAAWQKRVQYPFILFQGRDTDEIQETKQQTYDLHTWTKNSVTTALISLANGLKYTDFLSESLQGRGLETNDSLVKPKWQDINYNLPIVMTNQELRWQNLPALDLGKRLVEKGLLEHWWYNKRPPLPLTKTIKERTLTELMDLLVQKGYPGIITPEVRERLVTTEKDTDFYNLLIDNLSPLRNTIRFIVFGGHLPLNTQYSHLSGGTLTAPEYDFWPSSISKIQDRTRFRPTQPILQELRESWAANSEVFVLPDLSLLGIKQ